MTYATYLPSLLRGPLAGPWGSRWLGAVGAALGAALDGALDAGTLVGPRHAPADAVVAFGDDRRTLRLPDEADEDYRARIDGAWESWGWVGTVWGMVYALKLLGIPSRPIAQRRWATTPDGRADLWARWWIHIPLGAITVGSVVIGSGWVVGGASPFDLLEVGSGWLVGKGVTVGSTATTEQIDAIRRQLYSARNARDRGEAVLLGERAVYVGLEGLAVGAFVVGAGPTITWRRELAVGNGWIVGNETSGTGPWWPRVGHDFIV